MGPAPAGGQHLGRRPAELRLRGDLRAGGRCPASRPTASTCAGWRSSRCCPGRSSGSTSSGSRPAASNPLLRKEIARAARRARTRVSDRALPRFTEEHERRPPHHRGAAAAHPGRRRRGRAARRGARRLPRSRCRASGAGSSAATAWSTSRTRSSASAAVGLRAYVALCEGSSPDDVIFLQLKQARRSVIAPLRPRRVRVARSTRDSGSSSTSRRCRRSQIPCWAGQLWASGSSTSGSSAT